MFVLLSQQNNIPYLGMKVINMNQELDKLIDKLQRETKPFIRKSSDVDGINSVLFRAVDAIRAAYDLGKKEKS